MQLFYSSAIPLSGKVVLSQEESRHCVRVLRKRAGDIIEMVDGQGNFGRAEITDAKDKACEARIISRVENFGRRSFKLSMAVALTKNAERFEWFAEKAAEAGIDEIFPMVTQKTERKKLNHERLVSILVSAMKQSGRAYLPVAHEPKKFQDIICTHPAGAQRFIAVCNWEKEIKHLRETYTTGGDVLVLIGPEGDFTAEEVNAAVSRGFTPVSLGRWRLRVETAALAACIGLNWLNE